MTGGSERVSIGRDSIAAERTGADSTAGDGNGRGAGMDASGAAAAGTGVGAGAAGAGRMAAVPLGVVRDWMGAGGALAQAAKPATVKTSSAREAGGKALNRQGNLSIDGNACRGLTGAATQRHESYRVKDGERPVVSPCAVDLMQRLPCPVGVLDGRNQPAANLHL